MEEKKNEANKLPFKEFLATVKWLFVFNFKLSPWASSFQILLRALSEIRPLLNAYVFAKILDKIIFITGNPDSNFNEIFPWLGFLLLFNLSFSALANFNEYVSAIMSLLVSYKAPIILSKQIDSLGIQTLENPEIVNKIQRTRETLGSINVDFANLTAFCARIFALIASSFVVVKTMPIIGLIILIAIIPEIISNRYFLRKDWNFWRSQTENRRKAFSASNTLNETSALHEITIASSFNFLSIIFNRFSDNYIKGQLKIEKNWMSWGYGLGLATDIAGMFGYVAILRNLFNKLISIGDVTFQMKSLDLFISNLSSTANSFANLYERMIKTNEIKTVFEMKPTIADGKIELEKFDSAPKISLKNISFSYPNSDKYVIKNLNLDIKPGEKIAIVGENGAGKTTLVKLLSRFYRVNDGEILINDTNINDLLMKSWHQNIGVLFQDYNIYPYLTLKENIHIGKPNEPVDMKKIEEAAKYANIDSFIKDYKNGYDQILSEKFIGGTRPSTGQWQKIAIARFFYRNSPVVIFDEPTASIDAVSEAEIFGKIYQFFAGKTVIIISHRFSTVRNADKIIVLDKGEIVESGTHEELMKLKCKYYKAFTIQAEGYKCNI